MANPTDQDLLIEELTKAIRTAHNVLIDEYGHADAPYEPVALEVIAGLNEALTWPAIVADSSTQRPARSTLGDYLLGLWAENVVHANPCDCDLEEEHLGSRCAEASGARPALLQDQGGFAPSPLMYLPPLLDEPPQDGSPPYVAVEATRAGDC